MTRSECLELHGHKDQVNRINLQGEHSESPTFGTLSEYLAARHRCIAYENEVNISSELTEEDYKLFDRNFENAMADILYTDDENPHDELDRVLNMMNAVSWTWVNHTNKNMKAPFASVPNRERFLGLIRYCYECCLNSNSAKASISTGGITVQTDILDHYVSIQFNAIDTEAFDDDAMH